MGKRNKKDSKKSRQKKKKRSWVLTLLVYVFIALLFAPFVISRLFPGLIEEKLAPNVSPSVLQSIKTALSKTAPGGDSPTASPSGKGKPSTDIAATGIQVTSENKILHPCELIQVVDGDTIKVKLDNKYVFVRFLRINTPEKKMWGCQEATDTLRAFLDGKHISLEFEEPGVPAKDAYYRLLAYVYADNKNINIEMVRSGWTSFWTKFGEGKYAGEFMAAQQEAERAQRGLWGAFAEKPATSK